MLEIEHPNLKKIIHKEFGCFLNQIYSVVFGSTYMKNTSTFYLYISNSDLNILVELNKNLKW